MENLKDNELSTLLIDNLEKKDILNYFSLLNLKYIKKKNIINFDENGITIIENAISDELIEDFLKITNKTKNNKLHITYNEAAKILCHEAIKEFLEIIYKEQITLFQSQYFKKETEQELHQDAMFIVVKPHPYNLITVWIALEDILEETGEFIYLPGSHTKMKFRYGDGRIHFDIKKEVNYDLYNHHLYVLKNMAKNIDNRLIYPKKGDIVIWHAGLVHGISKINNNLTRKCIIGHYCPNSNNPYDVNNSGSVNSINLI